MSYVFSANIYFLLALDVQKKEKERRRWRIVGIFKFQNPPPTVSLAYNTS